MIAGPQSNESICPECKGWDRFKKLPFSTEYREIHCHTCFGLGHVGGRYDEITAGRLKVVGPITERLIETITGEGVITKL